MIYRQIGALKVGDTVLIGTPQALVAWRVVSIADAQPPRPWKVSLEAGTHRATLTARPGDLAAVIPTLDVDPPPVTVGSEPEGAHTIQ